jgi:hypothetical protein
MIVTLLFQFDYNIKKRKSLPHPNLVNHCVFLVILIIFVARQSGQMFRP